MDSLKRVGQENRPWRVLLQGSKHFNHTNFSPFQTQNDNGDSVESEEDVEEEIKMGDQAQQLGDV